jgi:hypothetical protein
VGEQLGIGQVVYINPMEEEEGVKKTDVRGTVKGKGIQNELDKGVLSCGASAGEHSDGTYTGDETILGVNTAGNQIDLKTMGKL